MGRFSFFLVLLFIGAIAAGGAFLLMWEIPAPTTKVEKVIPNDRLKE